MKIKQEVLNKLVNNSKQQKKINTIIKKYIMTDIGLIVKKRKHTT